MTTEEKAKAYDETLERAKEIKSKILSSHLSTESRKAVSEYIDTIIPELAESEDERIRKELLEEIDFIIPHEYESDSEGRILPSYSARINKYRAYLEKQKEHTLSTKETELNSIAFLEQLGYTCIPPSEQKPAEWSEEDEEMKESIINFLESKQVYAHSRTNMIVWLESLRPQPKWKPSEEQMDALDEYIWAKEPNKNKAKYVISLYEDLKKLM